MQRYFVSSQSFNSDYVIIEGEDARHITKVMRMTEGSKIICCDEQGMCFLCRVETTSPDKVQAAVESEIDGQSEMPVRVTVAQGLPKGDKLELVIQKGTELGARAFIPFQAERSIVKWDKKKEKKKQERWNKIAKEASEQSHRQLVPEIYDVQTVNGLVSLFDEYDAVILAYEEEARSDEKSLFNRTLSKLKHGDRLLLITGPEGGFSDREVTRMKNAGAVSCSLGPRILRCETAPLYGLAAISYHFEISG